MNFKQLFDYELRIAHSMGNWPRIPAYSYKGLLQLRAFNYKCRRFAQNSPLKALNDMRAYSLSIKQLTALPESLTL